MAIGNGSGRRLAIVEETGWGNIPANPTFQIARFTGGSLVAEKLLATSDEIQAHENVVDEFLVGWQAGGSYSFELSYGGWFDTLFKSVCRSDFVATTTMKNGSTDVFFTAEETYELGTTDQYYRYPGSQVNSMTLNIPAQGLVTGSVEVMSKRELSDIVVLPGTVTYLAANAKAVMGSSQAATFDITSPSLGAIVRSVTFNLNSNLRRRPDIEQLYSNAFGHGRFEITGSMDVYFESTAAAENAIWKKNIDHDDSVLTVTIGSVNNERYRFILPKMRILAGERNPGGHSDDIMMTLPFRGMYDATEACSLKILKGAAVT